ncbi:porin family protein [Rufibacter psychrotolerans]|uniref:porin family protein n=1 Tax=Rufibacter psychrotolerans TaxID=2812556 RepID=UPI0019680CA3|nr:porin family protein [Rufibacter sp. SYSU D00308]
MKKLVFFIAALFMTYFAQAQGEIKVGIKAGGNFSNWTGDDVEAFEELFDTKMEYKFGFHAGLFADYSFSEMVSVRPELLYSLKGWKMEEEDETFKVNLSYIDVPILARIKAGALFFELGPTVSFNVASKYKLTGGDEDEDGDFKDVFGGDPETVDIGYAAGLGYELPVGVGIGLRYNGGLSKVAEDGKVYNSNFMLSLSYAFGGR